MVSGSRDGSRALNRQIFTGPWAGLPGCRAAGVRIRRVERQGWGARKESKNLAPQGCYRSLESRTSIFRSSLCAWSAVVGSWRFLSTRCTH